MATLEQERHVELVSGTTEKFLITSRMVDATAEQLPHLNVFVLTLRVRTDAKSDTLTRIARLSDLTSLPQGRDAALASASGVNIEFLSPTTLTVYATLSEALAASTAIKERVNKLIEDWISYGADFEALDPDPATYTLPSVGATQVTTLITAYKVAKQTRYTSTLAKAEADAVLSRAQGTYTAALQRKADLEGIVSRATLVATSMESLQGYLQSLITSSQGLSSYVDALALYQPTIGVDPGEPDIAAQSAVDSAVGAFQTAIDAAILGDTSGSLYVTDAETVVTLLTAYYADLTTEASAASTALTTAQAAQLTAAQTLTSITATEASTLAAVLAVCPDFNKYSIALLDDVAP